jgi:GTPase Era involved in 16S rRNA processing
MITITCDYCHEKIATNDYQSIFLGVRGYTDSMCKAYELHKHCMENFITHVDTLIHLIEVENKPCSTTG